MHQVLRTMYNSLGFRVKNDGNRFLTGIELHKTLYKVSVTNSTLMMAVCMCMICH